MTETTRRDLLIRAGFWGAAPLLPTAFRSRSAAAQPPPAVEMLRLFGPSGAGGGWDGVARGMERVLKETGAIRTAQVENVTGDGMARSLAWARAGEACGWQPLLPAAA